jgi:hypothetical protein
MSRAESCPGAACHEYAKHQQYTVPFGDGPFCGPLPPLQESRRPNSFAACGLDQHGHVGTAGFGHCRRIDATRADAQCQHGWRSFIHNDEQRLLRIPSAAAEGFLADPAVPEHGVDLLQPGPGLERQRQQHVIDFKRNGQPDERVSKPLVVTWLVVWRNNRCVRQHHAELAIVSENTGKQLEREWYHGSARRIRRHGCLIVFWLRPTTVPPVVA